MRLIRPRRPRRASIDPMFARVLAGQVAAGLLTNGEPDGPPAADQWNRELEQAVARSRGALAVIGLMLHNAAPDDDVVSDLLRIAPGQPARCGFVPPDGSGFGACTRAVGHAGPCAHPLPER